MVGAAAASWAMAVARVRTKLMALVKQSRAQDALVHLHSKGASVEGLAQPLLLRAKVWNAVQREPNEPNNAHGRTNLDMFLVISRL